MKAIVRVAAAEQLSFRERDDGVRALQPRHRLRDGERQGRRVVRDERRRFRAGRTGREGGDGGED